MSGAVGTTGSDVRPDARPVFIRHAASALGLVCPESSVLYRVPEIVTRGRFPDGGESDSTWRTQEARHVGSDTIAPGF
jgi:hypothetical protein